MIYLDNAATSYPKPERVYDEMMRCMKEYCANPEEVDMTCQYGREGQCLKPVKQWHGFLT